MDWPVKQLTDVVESFHQGLNTAGEKIKFVDSGFPIIQTRNLSDGKIDLDKKIKYLSQVDWDKYREKYRPEIGDVFFTNIGTIGKTAVVNESLDYLIHWNIFKIRPFKVDVSPNYLKCYLDFLTSTGYFCDSQKGGTVSFVTKKMMGAVEIPLPPIPEQQRIVAILDQAFADIEKARANAEKNLKNARELFDSYLNQVFSQRGEGWVDAKLSDCSTLITKGSSPKWQGVSYVESPGVLFVTSENVGSNKMLFNKTKYVEEVFNEKDSKSVLQKGDVLTNIVGASIGRTAIYDRDDIANINQAVCMIRCESQKLSNEYLAYLLNSPYLVKILHDNEIDNARANLSLGFFRGLEIPLPSLEEQSRLVSCIAEFKCSQELMESLYQDKLNSLDELKKSLLQKAFSGELTKTEDMVA